MGNQVLNTIERTSKIAFPATLLSNPIAGNDVS